MAAAPMHEPSCRWIGHVPLASVHDHRYIRPCRIENEWRENRPSGEYMRKPSAHRLEQGRVSRVRNRQVQLIERGKIVEIVWLDRAACEAIDPAHELGPRDPATGFPIAPHLPNRANLGRTGVEREVVLAEAPTAERVVSIGHLALCKGNAYSHAIAVSDREAIFVSAEVLHFFPMIDDPNRIRELRLARDWSQQTLADLVGVSKVTISDLERGKMALTVDYMRRIAAALSTTGAHVAAADLLTPEDNPYGPRSDRERQVFENYRAADELQREMIERVAEPAAGYRDTPQKDVA